MHNTNQHQERLTNFAIDPMMSKVSQGTQTFFSTPMANPVDFTAKMEQKQTLQTEEEKMDALWLNLLNAQTNYCLGLMAHVHPSRRATEVVKASVFGNLGRVMGDARKAYEGFREICINLRQAPFTVPPLFADVKYKFTDIQLRNQQAHKKRQLLQETNAEWLK